MDFSKFSTATSTQSSSWLSTCKYFPTNVSLNRYDFDKDGYIISEDVRLILSHIPITNTLVGKVAQEGTYTQVGGGSSIFLDRI